MADNNDLKISQLPQAQSLTGSELLLFGGAANGSVSAETLKAYAQDGTQGELSDSDDIHISADGKLTITEQAKRAVFIDLWNKAAYRFGKYNETTGYFELNGLTDITYEEALETYVTYNGEARANYDHLAPQPIWVRHHIRTLLPINTWIDVISCERLASYSDIEVIRFYESRGDRVAVKCGNMNMVPGCSKLRSLLCGSGLQILSPYSFNGCSALETAEIAPGNYNLSFAESPLLSAYSLQFMVSKANNTSPITITLHPDAFARLTDEILEQAAAKNITFAEA